MRNVFIIFKREYLTRLKNKTFIVMTFLAPLLLVLFYVAAFIIAKESGNDDRIKTVFISESGAPLLLTYHPPTHYQFLPAPTNEDSAMAMVQRNEVDAWLKVGDIETQTIDSTFYYTAQTPSLIEMETLNDWLRKKASTRALNKIGIRESQFDSLQPNGKIITQEINASGNLENSSSTLKSGLGFAMAFLIYIFIFVYGSMVMRSAMEEKTNRIVEVIVSSVKPFHLMMGKILGVAAVGLTQFVAWIVLALLMILGVSKLFFGDSDKSQATLSQIQNTMGKMPEVQSQITQSDSAVQSAKFTDFMDPLNNLPIAEMAGIFILFFIGGYLLYSSFFAAIGSAVNQETDVQQFMMPVTLPLVLGFIVAQSVALQSPHGSMAKLFSMIPLTSPVVMVVRAPFGVPFSEVATSFGLLTITFLLMVWISSRIYRIGILSYGKKPTWKDLWKWMR